MALIGRGGVWIYGGVRTPTLVLTDPQVMIADLIANGKFTADLVASGKFTADMVASGKFTADMGAEGKFTATTCASERLSGSLLQ